MGLSYKDAGVNLNTAEESTQKIASLAKSTFNNRVLNEIGLFAGFFELDLEKYHHPVLVSSIDGVGTKLKIAFMLNHHSSVGQDLVNHCINDIMTCGADPLFFLDYIGTQSLQARVAEEIIFGMAKACKENKVALIGGETAEMPGFYSKGEYDLAGTIIGVVNRDDVIDGKNIQPDDVLIGLNSTGLHTNGFSLARKVLLEHAKIDIAQFDSRLYTTWGEALLAVHKSYKKPIQAVRKIQGVTGISHITGGGLVGNTKRLLQPGLALNIDWNSWQVPTLFKLIQELGDISDDEMRQVFNLGIGLVFVVRPDSAHTIVQILNDMDEPAVIIGSVVRQEKDVQNI
jgi:phosphoribosylformylglycinamidine cyclo-ligase